MGILKPDAIRLAETLDLVRKQHLQLRDLKKELAYKNHANDTAEEIRETIMGLSARSPEPPKWVLGNLGRSGFRGTPITNWSDWHAGEVVNPREVGGYNKFNVSIMQERAKRLVETTIDIAFHHMGRAKTQYPGIIVCLGGDMVGGDIHEELMATNDRTPHQSIHDLTDTLGAALETVATKFGRVFVPAVVGNHGRTTRKPRMKGRVYTNYDWTVYCNLERYFRREKHIQFLVSPEADARFSIYGHDYFLTHGDSIAARGGDGVIGPIGPITRGIIKIVNSEARAGRNTDTVIMGHHHTSLWLPNGIVNNSLKGLDEYAHLQLRAAPTRASQALWFHHPEHGITARWEIFLQGKKQADRQEKGWVTWLRDKVA